MYWYRIRHTLGMALKKSGQARAQYLKSHRIFRHVGEHCMYMGRKIPLYPELISLGDNVWIASDVLLVTHDAIHHMLNYRENGGFTENIGCIDIGNNVFIGSNTTVLPNVKIGSDTIIAAGSLVNKDLAGNGVYGGVPAKYLGSFEEFIKKRKETQLSEVLHDKGGISEELVLELWTEIEKR